MALPLAAILIFSAITSAITEAIRLAGCGTVPLRVRGILLAAVALVCLILVKLGFDRMEARAKRKKNEDKKD
ncbi:MAG TPA: hypothetical protein VE377_13405 [Candidatus Dormibacteraeota bacterium]|nr:hypothetical protein [Candidatus Dormibacteraeota bacterium]